MNKLFKKILNFFSGGTIEFKEQEELRHSLHKAEITIENYVWEQKAKDCREIGIKPPLPPKPKPPLDRINFFY